MNKPARRDADHEDRSHVLIVRNRQRVRSVNMPMLRRVTRHVLEQELNVADYELGFHLVDAAEMAAVNEAFLGHEGSTDVITFDHGSSAGRVHGEVFISVPDAVKQAREFRTTWPAELVRYVIHALLHLRGFDDLNPAKRRVMKREENRLVRRVAAAFALQGMARTNQR